MYKCTRILSPFCGRFIRGHLGDQGNPKSESHTGLTLSSQVNPELEVPAGKDFKYCLCPCYLILNSNVKPSCKGQ